MSLRRQFIFRLPVMGFVSQTVTHAYGAGMMGGVETAKQRF